MRYPADPHIRILFASAPALLRERNVADPVRIEEGSFYDSVPGGGDAVVAVDESIDVDVNGCRI